MRRRLVLACLILGWISLVAGCQDAAGPPPAPATATAGFAPTLPIAPPREIQIPDGATGILLPDEQAPEGGSVAYHLSASAGQRLDVGIDPFSAASIADFSLEVTGSGGGVALQPLEFGVVAWSGELPTSQTYRLTVHNAGPASAYALQVQLPRRVNFVPGPIAATIAGVVVQPMANVYLVRVRAGQAMTATVSSPGDVVWLGVVGEDGQPLLRLPLGQAAFAGRLPLSGDYTLDVAVLNEPAPPAVPFTLTLEISD